MPQDLVFLHSGATPECSARVDKHFVDYWTLQFMEAGAVELSYGDTNCGEAAGGLRCIDGGGWIWPAFPGPRIRFHPARDVHHWNHRYAAFTGPMVRHWMDAGLWPPGPQPVRAADFTAPFDAMLGLIRGDGAWSTRRAINQLEGILLALAEGRAAASSEETWLETARRYLEAPDQFEPDYAALARELGMGLSTLRRKFKAATGHSLHDTYLSNRHARARRLLGETDLPLKAIAARLGYRDVFFFSNQFKQQAGVGPLAFRRSRQ